MATALWVPSPPTEIRSEKRLAVSVAAQRSRPWRRGKTSSRTCAAPGAQLLPQETGRGQGATVPGPRRGDDLDGTKSPGPSCPDREKRSRSSPHARGSSAPVFAKDGRDLQVRCLKEPGSRATWYVACSGMCDNTVAQGHGRWPCKGAAIGLRLGLPPGRASGGSGSARNRLPFCASPRSVRHACNLLTSRTTDSGTVSD